MKAIELHNGDLLIGRALLRRMPEVLVLDRRDNRLLHWALPEVKFLGLGRLPAALDDGDDRLVYLLMGLMERLLLS